MTCRKGNITEWTNNYWYARWSADSQSYAVFYKGTHFGNFYRFSEVENYLK